MKQYPDVTVYTVRDLNHCCVIIHCDQNTKGGNGNIEQFWFIYKQRCADALHVNDTFQSQRKNVGYMLYINIC